MKQTEILRGLHRLIAEGGLIEPDEDEDPVIVSPVDIDGEYCGWNHVSALLLEFEDSGKNYILTIEQE